MNQWLHPYANVTKSNPKQEIPKQKTTWEQRKSNTYTIFNLMTAENITDQIIRELVADFGKSAKELLTKVRRDNRFRNRYQITFQNKDDIENLITNGITINGEICHLNQLWNSKKRKTYDKEVLTLPNGWKYWKKIKLFPVSFFQRVFISFIKMCF